MAAQLTLVLRLSLVLLQLSQDTLTFPRLLTLRVTTLHGAREVFPGAGASPTQPGAAQPCDPCKACTAWVLGYFFGGLAPCAPPDASVLWLVPCGRAVTAHQHCLWLWALVHTMSTEPDWQTSLSLTGRAQSGT